MDPHILDPANGPPISTTGGPMDPHVSDPANGPPISTTGGPMDPHISDPTFIAALIENTRISSTANVEKNRPTLPQT